MNTINAIADTLLTLVLLAPCFIIGLLMLADALAGGAE
jgi:hypothetical protein